MRKKFLAIEIPTAMEILEFVSISIKIQRGVLFIELKIFELFDFFLKFDVNIQVFK